MGRMTYLTLLLSLFLVTPGLAAKKGAKARSQSAAKALEVLNELQKSWDANETFRCRFEQAVTSKQLGGDPDVTEGTLVIAKPDSLRWESETESTTTILNAKELILIRRSLRKTTTSVDFYKKGKSDFIPKSLSFLTGRGKFKDLYKYELLEDSATSAKLKLTPKDRPGEAYIAEILKDGYVLGSLVTETVDTRVVTKFSKLEKNPKLEPGLFEYKAQPNDVVNRH